jgi:hypothetical protein
MEEIWTESCEEQPSPSVSNLNLFWFLSLMQKTLHTLCAVCLLLPHLAFFLKELNQALDGFQHQGFEQGFQISAVPGA